jgi:hypothetical protein
VDETSPWDLIEFWNLRALGWHIEPLPVSKLKTPPQRAELVSKILCRPALSFGSTTNAKRRGRTLTVALSIEFLEIPRLILT